MRGKHILLALLNAALFCLWIALSDAFGSYRMPTAWLVALINLQALALCIALAGPAGERGGWRLLPGACALGAALALAALAFQLPLWVQAYVRPAPKVAAREELLPYGAAGALCLGCLFAQRKAPLRKCAAAAVFAALLALNFQLPRVDDTMRARLPTLFHLAVYPVLLAALVMLAAPMKRGASRRAVLALRAAAPVVAALAAVFLAALIRFCFVRGGGVIPPYRPVAIWSHVQPLPLTLVAAAFPLLRAALCTRAAGEVEKM